MAAKGQNELLKARDRTLSVFREDAEQEWKGPFYFIQGADPQFGLMKAYAIGDCNSGGDEWEAELQLTRQAVEAVNRLNPKPKFFVLCGDLIHGMPGTEWREAQIRDLKNVLKGLRSDIPLIFVSGNHDLGNTPTPETIHDYCQHWGDDYFSFWLGGVFFLVLNSQLYFDASQCPELKEAQDTWLEQQLAMAEKKKCHHAVIFQHIPLFISEPDEDHNYFNLEKVVRYELLEKFCRAGVKAVFSGHCHRNAGGTYKDLDMVISSAIGCQLGDDTHGVRMVAVTAEKIVHRYYSLNELSNHQEVEKEFMGLINPN